MKKYFLYFDEEEESYLLRVLRKLWAIFNRNVSNDDRIPKKSIFGLFIY